MALLVDPDDLIDARGVAEILGLAQAGNVSLYQRRYPDMPHPVVDLGPGRPKLWLGREMQTWAERLRESGRTRPARRVTHALLLGGLDLTCRSGWLSCGEAAWGSAHSALGDGRGWASLNAEYCDQRPPALFRRGRARDGRIEHVAGPDEKLDALRVDGSRGRRATLSAQLAGSRADRARLHYLRKAGRQSSPGMWCRSVTLTSSVMLLASQAAWSSSTS